ncbi:DUF6461 domain-containing protein [Nucisporomicrobium flavum]|uniref:DUF6461 domain-containing protein n=1 Tax=Nucisporomicrobium flavum TaxID=2785915 RepID=UPI0018F67E67|nr:DUF6461 domain-containing protein [Nucisporomicrobium flavum]
MADLVRAEALFYRLGDIFCSTFIKGVDEAEALRRMGGYADTFARRSEAELDELMDDFDEGYPRMAAALALGAWSVVVEPYGFEGSDVALLESLSRGTEALSVLRHDYASPQVAYAIDGTVVAGFDPDFSAGDRMWGSDPAALRPFMRDAGFADSSADDEDSWEPAGPKALVLAELVTGTRMPADPFTAAALSAQIEPWFVTPPGPGDRLTADSYERGTGDLVAAAERAGPARQRTSAVAEVTRLAATLGLDGIPELTDFLDSAAQGVATPVAADSGLGHHVRDWLTAQKRAGDSLNGPDRARLSDAQRTQGYRYGWFVTALRGLLDPDPKHALLAALRPVGSVPDLFGGAAARSAVLSSMASGT